MIVAMTGLALLLGLVAAGCGGKAKGEAGGEGAAEAALVAFTDPVSKLSLQYPSSWTKTSDSPLTFSGQDEFIKLEVVARTADPLAAAKADEASVRAVTPEYRAVSTVSSKEVKGAAVLSYEWGLEKSAVTGKPVRERADRYYISLGDGRLAILTGSAPTSRFDREQVRDIALTVKATP
ncbi:MAG: hypothetical protein EPO65_05555 [Dehalococcoidia bacterium]|nr:MAG: hypothetical protein EPO65_05555 [Dehalococcoidia bacterium]